MCLIKRPLACVFVLVLLIITLPVAKFSASAVGEGIELPWIELPEDVFEPEEPTTPNAPVGELPGVELPGIQLPDDPFEPEDPIDTVLKGDVDFSGMVDVADILKAKNLIMRETWTAKELQAGDLNVSGSMDVGDIMGIKQIIMTV